MLFSTNSKNLHTVTKRTSFRECAFSFFILLVVRSWLRHFGMLQETIPLPPFFSLFRSLIFRTQLDPLPPSPDPPHRWWLINLAFRLVLKLMTIATIVVLAGRPRCRRSRNFHWRSTAFCMIFSKLYPWTRSFGLDGMSSHRRHQQVVLLGEVVWCDVFEFLKKRSTVKLCVGSWS